jgi:hypothetical protein
MYVYNTQHTVRCKEATISNTNTTNRLNMEIVLQVQQINCYTYYNIYISDYFYKRPEQTFVWIQLPKRPSFSSLLHDVHKYAEIASKTSLYDKLDVYECNPPKLNLPDWKQQAARHTSISRQKCLIPHIPQISRHTNCVVSLHYWFGFLYVQQSLPLGCWKLPQCTQTHRMLSKCKA